MHQEKLCSTFEKTKKKASTIPWVFSLLLKKHGFLEFPAKTKRKNKNSAGGMQKRPSTCIIFLCLLGTLANATEYLSFSQKSNGTNNIVIPENEIWELCTFAAINSWFKVFSSTNLIPENEIGQINSNGNALNRGSVDYPGFISIPLKGPLSIVNQQPFSSGTNLNKYYFLFKKISGGSEALINPASVVIPSSVAGDVDVILEQSQDGVTWTQCLPGTYNSSTVKRFFRLRAVEK